MVAATLIGFSAVYITLIVIDVYLLRKYARQDPELGEDDEAGPVVPLQSVA